MRYVIKLLMVFWLGVLSLNCAGRPEVVRPDVPVRDVPAVTSGRLREMAKEIYNGDAEVRNHKKEIDDLRRAAEQAESAKQFSLADDLKKKADKKETELKDYNSKLETALKDYEEARNNQPWWQQLALEAGSSYTRFSGNLDLDQAWGLTVKAHFIKGGFRRFHLGSYLYYPMEVSENYPLHQVEASPFIIEYRHVATTMEVADKPKNVEMRSYRLGFGVLSQAWNNTYATIGIFGGLEQYRGTEPESDGPVAAYSIGLVQKLSNTFSIGLDASESAVWTRANQNKAKAVFNFSSTVFLRILF